MITALGNTKYDDYRVPVTEYCTDVEDYNWFILPNGYSVLCIKSMDSPCYDKDLFEIEVHDSNGDFVISKNVPGEPCTYDAWLTENDVVWYLEFFSEQPRTPEEGNN